MDTEHYPAQVFWSAEDQAFIAVAVDLPGSSAVGSTQAEALSELQIVIDGWIEAQNAVGNPIPSPSRPAAPSECNGKVLLRLPRWLHVSLVKGAKAEGVSLNSHIMAMLAAAVGAKCAGHVAVSGSAPQQSRSRTA
jgi:predicted RNase H-like HicB family nuclease